VSLFEAAERLVPVDRSTVILDSSRCLHFRDKFSECTACFNVCPESAIRPGEPPQLVIKSCLTCLACLPVCLTGAITADDAVPALLNCAARIENKRIEVVCEQHPDAEKGFGDTTGLRVRGCLAGLGVGTYMILAALGLETIIVRSDACGGCAWETLRDILESQVRQARQLLAHWNKEQILLWQPVVERPIDRPLWNVDNPPLSRRDLFRLAAHQGQLAIARAIENSPSSSKIYLNRDRLRMLGAVQHLPEYDRSTDSFVEMGFVWLSISDACTACGVCGRACPTGGLCFEKNENEKTFKITFSARKCIGCELCTHICAPEAIGRQSPPTFDQIFGAEIVILREGNLARCENCKTHYVVKTNTHLCPQCEFRNANPFGSMLPPGIRQGKQVPPKELL